MMVIMHSRTGVRRMYEIIMRSRRTVVKNLFVSGALAAYSSSSGTGTQ